jgi:hypothetical protein
MASARNTAVSSSCTTPDKLVATLDSVIRPTGPVHMQVVLAITGTLRNYYHLDLTNEKSCIAGTMRTA